MTISRPTSIARLRASTVGDRIRFARTSLRLSQQDVADAIGVNKSAISKMENGQTDPPPERRIELAQLLKVAQSELLELPAIRKPAKKGRPRRGRKHVTPLGQFVVDFMVQHEVSLTELAQASTVSVSALSRLTSGEARSCTDDVLHGLSVAMEADLGVLQELCELST